MSIVNSTHEPRNGMIRAENRRWPLGWMLSSNTTPGERCSCDTMTRSAPLMTNVPTFVINGAERVIVSQLHRSPGVVFEESIHPNGQRLFSARIIPFRGSWVEFTIDIHDVIYVHIDKKKKFPATALLRAFGYGTNADILSLFYATKELDITGKLEGRAQKREVLGTLLAVDVPDPENKKGEPLGRVGDELTLEKLNTFRRAGSPTPNGYARH